MSNLECLFVDGNISTWGKCLQATVAFGDPFVMAILSIFIFIILFYKLRLPGYLGLAFSAPFTYSLFIMSRNDMVAVLLALTVIFTMVWFGMVIISKIGKRW